MIDYCLVVWEQVYYLMVAGSEVEEKVQMEVEDLYDCNTTLSTHIHTKIDPQYRKNPS